jgi:hypothetical protein
MTDLDERMDGDGAPTCARAGCHKVATSIVNWRNPRIHGEDRVKTWPACAEHLDFLRDYLVNRSFPVQVTAVGVRLERIPSG